MNRVQSSELLAFSRRFRFAGGRLRRVRLSFRRGVPTLDVLVSVQKAMVGLGEAGERVRLRLQFTGVEEYRFQKRPSLAVGKMTEVRFGFYQGLFFVNFDAWGLSPGETPAVHDYRASETYAAARDMFWEEQERPQEN